MFKRPFRRNRKLLLVAFTLAIISLLFFTTPVLSGLKKISLKVILFPVRALSVTGRHLNSKNFLIEENIALKKKVADLSLEAALLCDLVNENKRLRELLRFKKEFGFDTVSAEVIVRDPNDWLGSFVINKGTNDGVRVNSAVCSAKGLLGKVIETSRDTSSVMLITHPGFKAGGMIKDTRVNAIVVGGGKDTVRMLYIPMEVDIRKDFVVVTSGYSRVFPKGIVIGKIVSIGRSRTGLYKYAIIKPAASFFDQEEVLCIK